MASSQAESSTPGPSTAAAATDPMSLVASYSSRIWRTLQGCLPSPDSLFLAKISHLYRRPSPAHRHRRQKPGLPLPLHSTAAQSSLIAARASTTSILLEDIMEHILCNLYNVQKSMQFWQSRAEGTNAQKIYFIIFERGPWAFIDGTYKMLSRFCTDGSPFHHLSHAAFDTISHKIAILISLQHCLASFLAQVYLEVNKYGGILIEDADKSFPLILLSINGLFFKLESSIALAHEICNIRVTSCPLWAQIALLLFTLRRYPKWILKSLSGQMLRSGMLQIRFIKISRDLNRICQLLPSSIAPTPMGDKDQYSSRCCQCSCSYTRIAHHSSGCEAP